MATFGRNMDAILSENRSAVHVHVQFEFLVEQFHVYSHSSVRRNEIQTSSDKALLAPQLVLALWLHHIYQ